MPTDVTAAVVHFIERLLGDPNTAAQYAADPRGTLAANGLTEQNLDGVNMRQAVNQACTATTVPHETRTALQGYTSGGHESAGHYTPPSGGYEHQSVEQVMQHLNYVTYVSYKDNHSVTEYLDNSTRVDNSTHLSVHGDVSGEITVDSHNATATGAGSVADSGYGSITAATGAGAVAGSGSSSVSAATGSHSQAIGGSNYGQANTGDGAVQQGPGSHGAVNTGYNSGVVGNGVHDTVVGNHNQAVQGTGPVTNSVIDFGGGHVSNASGNTQYGGGAISAGGNAHNVSGNHLDHGSGLATDGSSASGYNDQHTSTSTHITEHFDQHITIEPHPVLSEPDHGHGELSHSGYEVVPNAGSEGHYAPSTPQVQDPVQHDSTVLPDHHS